MAACSVNITRGCVRSVDNWICGEAKKEGGGGDEKRRYCTDS